MEDILYIKKKMLFLLLIIKTQHWESKENLIVFKEFIRKRHLMKLIYLGAN